MDVVVVVCGVNRLLLDSDCDDSDDGDGLLLKLFIVLLPKLLLCVLITFKAAECETRLEIFVSEKV